MTEILILPPEVGVAELPAKIGERRSAPVALESTVIRISPPVDQMVLFATTIVSPITFTLELREEIVMSPPAMRLSYRSVA